MGVIYYHKPFGTDVYTDITDYVTKHFRWSETLGQRPQVTSFQVTFDDSTEVIEFLAGEEIAIVSSSKDIVYANGKLLDPDPELIGNDIDNDNDNLFRYDLKFQEIDYSKEVHQNYTATGKLLSVILDELLACASDLGGANLPKYTLYFADKVIKGFSLAFLTTREAVLDLLKRQNGMFSTYRYRVEPDTTNNISIERSLDIFDKRGLQMDSISSWWSGITDSIITCGEVPDPFNLSIENLTNTNIQTEVNVKVKSDTTIVSNYVLFHCNTYFLDDDTEVFRENLGSVLNQFTYQLNYVYDTIPFIASPKKAVDVVTGSTSLALKINEIDIIGLSVGDTILVKPANTAPEDIESILLADPDISTIKTLTRAATSTVDLDTPVSFTPVAGDYFEVIKNLDIFEDNQPEFEENGVVVNNNKGSKNSSIRFLDLTEPHPPQRINIFGKRIQTHKVIRKSEESIAKYGIKKKIVKLDPDIVLTRDQAATTVNDLMILEPNFTLTATSYRPEKLRIGTMIPINLAGQLEDNLLVQSVNGEFLGNDDHGGSPAFKQAIVLSTLRDNAEDILKELTRKKTSVPVGFTDESYLQSEKIKVQDFMSYIVRRIQIEVSINLSSLYFDFTEGSGSPVDKISSISASLVGGASWDTADILYGNNVDTQDTVDSFRGIDVPYDTRYHTATHVTGAALFVPSASPSGANIVFSKFETFVIQHNIAGHYGLVAYDTSGTLTVYNSTVSPPWALGEFNVIGFSFNTQNDTMMMVAATESTAPTVLTLTPSFNNISNLSDIGWTSNALSMFLARSHNTTVSGFQLGNIYSAALYNQPRNSQYFIDMFTDMGF